MTEADWNNAESFETLAVGRSRHYYWHAMLVYLRTTSRLTERKNRLFSVACCYRVWQHLEEPSRQAVRVIEQFAEGRATEPERAVAEAVATAVSARLASTITSESCAAAAVLNLTASTEAETTWWVGFGQFIAEQVAWYVYTAEWEALGYEEAERVGPEGRDEPGRGLIHLVLDIFGNPFRIVTLEKSWLTPDVIMIAQAIYDEKAFERMGILADVLEQAGCANADVLGHCRGVELHVRGCWLLDLVIGKA